MLEPFPRCQPPASNFVPSGLSSTAGQIPCYADMFHEQAKLLQKVLLPRKG